MQIIIDIPEEVYKSIKSNEEIITYIAKNGGGSMGLQGSLAIVNGTILPKGHGRLIDVNEIPIDGDYYDVDNAPTIIEADCTYRETGCGSCKNYLNCPYDKESD